MIVIVAAAAAIAATGVQISRSGDSTELKRFADILADRRVDVVQLFLRVEEATSDGIAEQCVAVFFERGNLIRAERL